MKTKTIVLIVLPLIVVIILLQNMTDVDINLLFWKIEMPKLILLALTIFLGWVAGWFTHILHIKNKQAKMHEKTDN